MDTLARDVDPALHRECRPLPLCSAKCQPSPRSSASWTALALPWRVPTRTKTSMVPLLSRRSEARCGARRSPSSTTSGRTTATTRTRATTRRSRATTSLRARWGPGARRRWARRPRRSCTTRRATTRAPSPTRARPSSARAQTVTKKQRSQ
ncbi:unnamed protein product [Arctia plantaginis]|uniref:Uncharacterized protein n=1 Tax=Arctia plantaginis TaxID=874455 RepID=A0A8S0Z5M7_ARCPL|nr:unnamed protein product [Arctia plantaginis]